MVDDLATRLIAHNSCGCGCSSDTRRLIGEAADEIERLREERDYLRHELNNETDRYIAMKETNSGHVAEIELLRGQLENVQRDRMAQVEVERMRALITEWADANVSYYATDDASNAPAERVKAAEDALLKEAGR
jgi:hypothetical protein